MAKLRRYRSSAIHFWPTHPIFKKSAYNTRNCAQTALNTQSLLNNDSRIQEGFRMTRAHSDRASFSLQLLHDHRVVWPPETSNRRRFGSRFLRVGCWRFRSTLCRCPQIGWVMELSAYQLKILQECITLVVFMLFAWAVLGETPKPRYLISFALICAAVAVAFSRRPALSAGFVCRAQRQDVRPTSVEPALLGIRGWE